MTSYIYQVLNTVNGKVYIGRTNDLSRRWREHLAEAKKSSKPFYKAITKYGEASFDFRIIQEVSSDIGAADCEMYWIQYYRSNMIRYGTEYGYNLSDGGEGCGTGPKSQSHRDNISKALTGLIRTPNHSMNISISKTTLSNNDLAQIKQLLNCNVPEHIIADRIGISQGVVSDIKLGRSHRYFFSEEDIKVFDSRFYDRAGQNNPSAKLSEQQVSEIKSLIRSGKSHAFIARLYQVGTSTISRINTGKCWGQIK